jgi:hypothetical protein
MNDSLVQPLFDGPLDIIGDVHGEFDALLKLLKVLGYDENGNHPDDRKLIFVGDLCDRGHDSPSVILFVMNLIKNNNAQMVLGNHELNLLQNKAKDGSGWFFDQQIKHDTKYEPYQKVNINDREKIYHFLSNLPIALENNQLRVIHAAWIDEQINEVRNIETGKVIDYFNQYEQNINIELNRGPLMINYKEEQSLWREQINDASFKDMPFLKWTSQYNLIHQQTNPLRVLTSGIEDVSEKPFFAAGKWRFVKRKAWWNDYQSNIPVVIGHYWRNLDNNRVLDKDYENIFENVDALEWHNNVFCVDFSVGSRYLERNHGINNNSKLAALQFPEKTLTTEDGIIYQTFENKSSSITFS